MHCMQGTRMASDLYCGHCCMSRLTWRSYSLGGPLPRCTTCAKFTQRMKTARGDERQQVLRAQSDHLNMVMQWRTAQTRMNHLSEDALRPGRKDNQHELFKVDVDACDEAKFRVPRNTSNAKALEAVWRPQLHLHGALSWGVPCPT